MALTVNNSGMTIYRIVLLGLLLAIVWISCCGELTPFMTAAGVISITAAILIAYALDCLDEEGAPAEALPRLPGYFIWLAGEMIKSSLRVMKISLGSNPVISPSFVAVNGIGNPVADVVFANSITLTPGTVTVVMNEADKTLLMVHALESATPESFNHMAAMAQKLFKS